MSHHTPRHKTQDTPPPQHQHTHQHTQQHTHQHTHTQHNTTHTTQHSTHFQDTYMANTAQHNTPHTEPTPDSIRENSPAPDTARIDRLIALSSFSVWWCMAVLSWCSDFLVNSFSVRHLSLQKYPFSASWQVNSFFSNYLIYAVTVFFKNYFSIIYVCSFSFFKFFRII